MEKLETTAASIEALEKESLAWLNQLLSGAVTHDQAKAFTAWRDSSPERAEAFARIARFRRTARRAIQAERLGEAEPSARRSRPTARRASPAVTRRALLGGALAASGAGFMILRPLDHLWSELTADYHTATGERRDLTIARNVALELNTRTSVSRRTIGGMVGLDLLSGEAAITANRSPDAPFRVQASVADTLIAQGAANLEVNGETVCVTCLAGALQVDHPAGRRRLIAGQQLTYTPKDLSQPATADTQVVSAWRRGLLIFRDAPLQQVVDELNRYRAGRIILTDAALARRPVYGVFRTRQIAQAVQQVQALTGAKVVDLPGGIVLLS